MARSSASAPRYRVRDLAAANDITVRAVRYYVEARLLPRPAGRGTGLLYTEEHMLRLRAICHLRKQRLPIPEVARRLARLSSEELAALVPPAEPAPEPPAPPAPPPPSPATAPPPPARTDLAEPADSSVSTAPAEPLGAEDWRRIVLLPGLELHVRADSRPLVLRMAREIQDRYAAVVPS